MEALSIGIHRGKRYKENSLKAIKEALRYAPSFIEFDVLEWNKKLRTGHPPEKPCSFFSNVIKLFKKTLAYPKIDLKLNKENYKRVINKVIEEITNNKIRFSVVNIGSIKKEDYKFYMDAEKYFHSIRKENIKLNIDLERYNVKENFKEILEHLESIQESIYSISPEARSNISEIIYFAKRFGIKNIMFWVDEERGEINKEELNFKIKTLIDLGFIVSLDINEKTMKSFLNIEF